MASSFSGVPTTPARRTPAPQRAASHAAQGADLEVLLDRWMKRLEGEEPSRAREPPAVSPGPPDGATSAAATSALDGVAIRGSSATFADAPGESIVLELGASTIAHRGTVGVRGPLVSLRSLASGAGLDEAQAAALDHVAAWFGAPFDAVTAGGEREPQLRWGFLGFGGESLARCLAAFAARDAAAFQAQLGRYQIGVTAAEPAGAPEIAVTDPASGAALRGGEAALVIAAEPRLVAVLARAGRHTAAQLAQVETAVSLLRSSLHVMLPDNADISAAPGDATASAALRSKRALAVLIYIDLAFGLRGAAAFVQDAPTDPSADEAAWIERFAARLERSRRSEHALAVRWIASSPELG